MLNTLANLLFYSSEVSQRALQGYKKALGLGLVKTYIPALNTTQNLTSLYTQLDRVSEAKAAYSCVLHGLEMVFGQSSKRFQDVAAALEALRIDNEH